MLNADINFFTCKCSDLSGKGGKSLSVSGQRKYRTKAILVLPIVHDFSIVTPCRIVKNEFFIQWTVHRITWQ